MMKIEIDTHCHTIVSGHAYNTLREMVSMAAEKGLAGLSSGGSLLSDLAMPRRQEIFACFNRYRGLKL